MDPGQRPFCLWSFFRSVRIRGWEVALETLSNIWKFFVSVKLTVVLLLSLAASSIIGTVIPQNRSPEEYARAFGPFFYRLFEVLDIFDMYHSWWFQLLMFMLTANILVCSLDRLSATWHIIFAKNPSFRISRFRKQSGRASFTDPRPPEQLRDMGEQAALRYFRYVRVEPSDGGFTVFAEKWRWTRLGVYIVHGSVILLIIGGLIGSIFGFDGYVNIPEGESVRAIQLRNSAKALPLDFAIRCNDFRVSFYPSGQPKEYRSSLSLIEGGKTVYRKDIIVNDPIRFRGINIFQASYGKMPSAAPAADAAPPSQVTLAITSAATGMVYREKAALGQEIVLPEEAGTLVLKDYRASARFMGRDIGAAFEGILTPIGGEPAALMLPLHFPNFDKMRRGALVISVTGHKAKTFSAAGDIAEPRYYTGLQVTKDPGVGMVYAGFVLMIVGCFITFFMSHQQLCIEVTRQAKGSRVTVAGVSNRNRLRIQTKARAIAQSMAGSGELNK